MRIAEEFGYIRRGCRLDDRGCLDAHSNTFADRLSAQDAAASKRVPETLPPRPLVRGLLERQTRSIAYIGVRRKIQRQLAVEPSDQHTLPQNMAIHCFHHISPRRVFLQVQFCIERE